MSFGRRKDALLANAVEALIAAIYRDSDFATSRDVVLRMWGDRISKVKVDARDAKTALQEWAQARGLQPPVYSEIARKGPDHAPVFTIEARLDNGEAASAIAGSKRQAEQEAAAKLLKRLDTK